MSAVFAQLATAAGDNTAPNEDYALLNGDMAVVIDGLTARGATGCIHGVSWYARQLGNAIMMNGSLGTYAALGAALQDVANLHRTSCDLSHPGTPAAAVGIVQMVGDDLTYALLGDVTLVLNTRGTGVSVIGDYRIRATAPTERAEADSYPAGSVEKQQALIRMKQSELAARNVAGGYWAAASNPTVVRHAITASVPLAEVLDVAVLTDGAARLVDPFHVTDWAGLLGLLNDYGAGELLRRVRHIEESDPLGTRWPRNKKSDDATVVYLDRKVPVLYRTNV